MPLSTMSITSVSPRGGVPTTTLSVFGSGFGATTGTVVFDPLGDLGGPFAATPTLWQDDQIDFAVPAGFNSDNQFTTVLITKDGGGDQVSHRWWLPLAGVTPSPLAPPGLDYQWPNIEEGDLENDDDPRVAKAADFNRLLDFVHLTV